MVRSSTAIVLLGAAVLFGCAGTSSKVQTDYQLGSNEKLDLNLITPTDANEEGMAILRERLTTQLSANGLLVATSDPQGRTLEVIVTNYYMRHGATRALVGILAGVDNIKSTVRIKDKTNAKTLAEFTVESTNPTAWGTSRGMIQNHADEIIARLKGTKR